MKQKIIAVDFDGTLVKNLYPQIGETNEEVLDYCKKQQAKGARIILWTNRVGKFLDDAVAWCRKHGLRLDAVNDNLPEIVNAFGSNCRKIYADEFIDDHMSTRFVFPGIDLDISGSQTDWAHNEVALAIEATNNTENAEDARDIAACYKSALRAFNALMRDCHNGGQIHVTKGILSRLVDGKCLSPIEDEPDVWKDVTGVNGDDGGTHYQCLRMPSLFKDISADGKVTYTDLNRTQVIDINNPDLASVNSLATRVIDKIFPIVMPYLPDNKKFRVYRERFLTDKQKENEVTVGLLYVVTPDDRKVKLNLFYKTEADGSITPITKEAYEERKARKIQ